MINQLKDYNILLVDADVELAKVLKTMLADMGFSSVHISRSGKEAIELLNSTIYDFIITEWNTQHIDGIELLNYLRRSPNSPNPAMPVIMLTGRAEMTDVFLARDYGINEYVIKPFTARSIYNRLERIIEKPRSFVAVNSFVGPDRRHNGKPPEGGGERRTRNAPTPVQSNDLAKDLKMAREEPQVWLPDFTLKQKLGVDIKLGDLITSEVLSKAQSAIDSITSDSLQWIRDNLRELKTHYDLMVSPNFPYSIASDISDIALLVNARAGTFGYTRASEVAYGLYLFTRNRLNPENTEHHIVIQKHIEVLHVILGNQMRGNAGEVGAQIVKELKALVIKYS